MCKPKAPEPPDPQVTAGAQTGQNVSTAIANQNLQNINQVTPYGNLTYDQSGTYQMTDPNSGSVYDIPRFTATQTLSPDQQAILDSSNQAQISLGNLAANQAGRLDSLLSGGIDMSAVPGRQNFDAANQPAMQSYGNGPAMQTGVSSAGQGIQGQPGFGGSIQGNVQTQTDYTTGVNAGGVQTGVNATGGQRGSGGYAGPVNGRLQNSGQITQNVDIPQISGVPTISGGGSAGIDYQRSDLGNVQTGFGDTPQLNLDPNLPGYSQAGQTPQIDFTASTLGQTQNGIAQAGNIQTNANLPGIRDVQGASQLNFEQGQLGGIQGQLGQSGNIRTDANLPGVRDVQGPTQLNFQQGQLGGIQGQLGPSGNISTDAGLEGIRNIGGATQLNFQQGQLGDISTSFGDAGAIQTQANAPGIGQVQGADGINYNPSDLGQNSIQTGFRPGADQVRGGGCGRYYAQLRHRLFTRPPASRGRADAAHGPLFAA
jgi:hypothetical protein